MKKDYLHRLCVMACLIGMLFTGQQAAAQAVTLPYFCGFEDAAENANWVLNAGNAGQLATNKWFVSDAEVYAGDSALIISKDSGATATYSNTTVGIVAYRKICLPAGTYDLSFAYQAGGETNSDGIYACWVPGTQTTNSSMMGRPAWVINTAFAIDSVKMQSLTGGWRVTTQSITSTGDTMKLVFVWVNNGLYNIPPGGCIDNIQICSQSCDKPTDVDATVNNQDVTVTWSGNANSYDLMYRAYKQRALNRVTGITTNSYTIQGLGEGLYDFMVRANCSGDTSIYVTKQNVVVYDPTAHCINFTNLTAPGTTCTYGSYTNPKLNIGVVDSGYTDIASRHTVNYILGETDPRTGNGLATIPAGEIMSVRLGNWYAEAQGETVTYTFDVPDSSNTMLIVNHAEVFEEPGHDEAPEFSIMITDTLGRSLGSNFEHLVMCDGTLTDPTWHCFYGMSSYGYNTEIYWKEWTKFGFNLSQHAGERVSICLTTKDCNWNGHFGYAYFTLECAVAELQSVHELESSRTVYTAPEGFYYKWVNGCTGQVASQGKVFAIADNDTCTYSCICISIVDTNQKFTLTAKAIPHLPKSVIDYDIINTGCEKIIDFTNNSYVYKIEEGVKSLLPEYDVTAQQWSVQTEHQDRAYYNLTSDSSILEQIEIPAEGDTISVTLTTWFYQTTHDTTITFYIPALVPDTIRIDTIAQEGTSVHIQIPYAGHPTEYAVDTTITTSGNYVLYVSSWMGCDSLIIYYNIVFQEVTGVDIVSEAGFEVYLTPNPIKTGESTRITTDGEISAVEVFDLGGKCVKRIDTCEASIEIDGLNVSGIYMVRVIGKNGLTVTRKLIVE